ncbi:Methyltransferase TRM13 [Burkholderiales bacterium JOSHI_001]|nr:Methyltransferase TRM13 [Burkholderiales bacterium JOSHI_001]
MPLTADPADTPGADPQSARFLAALREAVAQQRFVSLVLAKPQGGEPGWQRTQVRLIDLRGVPHLSFLHRHDTRDITKNLPLDESLAQVDALLGAPFRNAHLHTTQQELQLSLSKKGKGHLVVKTLAHGDAAAAAPAAHNREKKRLLSLTRPFLHALGVTDAQAHLVPSMAAKWKQINKFVEIFSNALGASRLAGAKALTVMDFGAGKGYLTFAVHDWLRAQGVRPQVTGLELRPDLVKQCNAIIGRLQLDGLRFEQGDLNEQRPAAMNVMIALHACDTATDLALALGVKAGADILLASPCCHKQIRPQLLAPGPMKPVLQHGVHADEQAEMLTDALRALLLEAAGYDTQVFEFISLEHTAKNKMILAVKRAQPKPREPVLAQVAELKRFFGIREQSLETLLAA